MILEKVLPMTVRLMKKDGKNNRSQFPRLRGGYFVPWNHASHERNPDCKKSHTVKSLRLSH